ncbi:MAG: hypothetical protein QE263_03515 [Vampirovibrionales bacterium]|nr:hypothetical protein [Vampirovibrionales bacterium]
MIGNLFTTALGSLERSPYTFALVQEVAGSNLPKTFMTRTSNERVDVAAGQFGGTVAFFGSGWGLDKLLNWAYKRFAHIDLNALKESTVPIAAMEKRHLWAISGKSAAIFAIQGALYWAVPFARNILTAKRTGSGNFADVITNGNQQPVTTEQKRAKAQEAKEKIAYCKRMVCKILGGGALVALGALGLAAVGIKRGWGIGQLKGQWGNKLLETFALARGDLGNYPKWSQFLFIAVASYAGWIHAVRDKFELKEQLLQFGGFLFGWFGPPAWAKTLFNKRFQSLLEKHVPNKTDADALYKKVMGTNWNGTEGKSLSIGEVEKHLAHLPEVAQKAKALCAKQTGFGLLVSAILLGAIPQFINWQLTAGRMASKNAGGDIKQASSTAAMLAPVSPVQQAALRRFNAFAQPYNPAIQQAQRA